MTSATAPVVSDSMSRSSMLLTLAGIIRRNLWTLGLLALLAVLFAFAKIAQPRYGEISIQGLGTSVLPLAFAAAAQAVIVIAGGIDLSIGSMMALTSVICATAMAGQGEEVGVLIVVGVVVLGMVLGATNGALVVVTRVPDIVVTLGLSFVWAGFALLVRAAPGGGASTWLKDLAIGPFLNGWIPKAAVAMLVVIAIIWIPVSRSKLGLSFYALGSDRLAAFRSGISVGRTRILAYMMGGLFAALGGISLTASTGIGTPVPGPYTLESVAAVVLGGVSLAGGRGGLLGPIIAVVVLQMVRTNMTFMGIDTNLAIVAQGVILISVLMAGTLFELRRRSQ